MIPASTGNTGQEGLLLFDGIGKVVTVIMRSYLRMDNFGSFSLTDNPKAESFGYRMRPVYGV
jgi:hypothetical protein